MDIIPATKTPSRVIINKGTIEPYTASTPRSHTKDRIAFAIERVNTNIDDKTITLYGDKTDLPTFEPYDWYVDRINPIKTNSKPANATEVLNMVIPKLSFMVREIIWY